MQGLDDFPVGADDSGVVFIEESVRRGGQAGWPQTTRRRMRPLRAALAYGSETFDRIARSSEATFATDSGDRIILWNKTCEALLERPARSVLGKRCYEVIGGLDIHGNMSIAAAPSHSRLARDRNSPFIVSLSRSRSAATVSGDSTALSLRFPLKLGALVFAIRHGLLEPDESW